MTRISKRVLKRIRKYKPAQFSKWSEGLNSVFSTVLFRQNEMCQLRTDFNPNDIEL